MDNPILTIAIPTYNRADYLVETLESVISQIEKDVEVIICDNASTDDTPKVVQEYCDKYKFIKYYRNTTNLGFDGNFLRCLREANGQFVHLLSDDDILLKDSIKAILKFIYANEEVGIINLNSCSFNGKYSIEKLSLPIYNTKKDIVFSDKNQFVEFVGTYLTFVSSLIFNKKTFQQIENCENYFGTCLLQSHVAFDCLGLNDKSAVISHICIAGRGGNSGGYNLYKVFAYEWSRVLFGTGCKNGIKHQVLKKIYKQTIKKHLVAWVVNFRLNPNKYELKNRWLLVKSTWNYLVAWLCLYPVVFIPKYLLTFLKKVYLYKKRFVSNW